MYVCKYKQIVCKYKCIKDNIIHYVGMKSHTTEGQTYYAGMKWHTTEEQTNTVTATLCKSLQKMEYAISTNPCYRYLEFERYKLTNI